MSDWADLLRTAERLGLTVERSAASGVLDGRRVSLEVEYVGREGTVVIARGHLDPPLDLGLEMRERTLGSLGEAEVVTGQPYLDGEFTFRSDDPGRLRAFFTTALRDQLAAYYRASFDLRVHDGGCTIFSREGIFLADSAWAEQALHAAARIADLMEEARAVVGPAAPLLPHAAILRTLAAARGFRLDEAPLFMSGKLEGRQVRIGAARTGRRKHHLFARAEFETPLSIGLHLRRQSLLDGVRVLLGAEDVIVGDAPFDKRFLIGADPERASLVGAILDAGTRALLLAIDARCGAIAADDHGVTVDPIPVDHAPEDLVWLVDSLVEVTARIGLNLIRGGADAGPYR